MMKKNIFKIKLLLTITTLFLSVSDLSAQYTFGGDLETCPTNLVIANCSGSETFSGTYDNNPLGYQFGNGIQICSSDGSPITITFTANTVEGGFDQVGVYDGQNQYNYTLIDFGDETGFNSGQPAVGATYTSTGECIFVSVLADGTANGQIAFDIDCGGGGAGSGLGTEPVGPGTALDGISPTNDFCSNPYTLSNTYNQPVTLVANNYDTTSGPGDNTCDPAPSSVSGQLTLESTAYFEYCTDGNPGLYQGHGILNVENCIRPAGGGIGSSPLYTGTCGNFTPVSYNIGDQLPANTCFTIIVDGLNGDECQFQPYFDESPPPTCDPIFTGDAESYWLEAPDCGYFGTWSAGVDWGTFFTTDPCVSCDIFGNCSVNIETDFQLVFVSTTDGVITAFDACAGEGIDMIDNDFDNLPAHSGGCDIEWYTIKYRVTGSSPDADCVCDGYCFESPAANFPVFPDYFGSAFADITIVSGVCNADGTYTPTEIEVTAGSACDGSVTVANSIIQPDPGCGNPTGEDLLVVELAITPADFPASCGAAIAGTFTLSSITCECPAECGAVYDFVVDDFCSGDAAFFDLQAGCSVEVNPATGQPYVDFDWYVYAPGGVPGEAPPAYDPLPATNDDFPITNPDLILDGSETACSDVAGSNAIVNNTCDPIVVTYYMLPWDRQFDSDGDFFFGEYFVGAGACPPLRFDITIYPEPFTAVETAGNCSAAMVEIQSADGTVCPPLNGEATSGALTTDLGCGMVDNQIFNYTFDYFAGTPCPQNIVGSVSSSCFGTCPPPLPDCSTYFDAMAGDACSGQNFVVTIPLDECPGTVSFDVDIEFLDGFASEYEWEVIDAMGNVVVSSGASPYPNGTASASESFGPLPAADGPYTFQVTDTFGDGGHQTTITDAVSGNVVFVNGAVNDIRDFNLASLVIDPFFDLDVNWYANGVLVNSDLGVPCNNFSYAYVLTTTNTCEPDPQQISYEVICLDGTPTTIATGVMDVLVYPDPPTAPTDVVTITIDCENSTPIITFEDDCSTDAVTVNEITPPVCGMDGTAEYEVIYDIGINAPACCETAGPDAPIMQSVTLDLADGYPANQFAGAGFNNAICFDIPAFGMGAGNATSYTYTYDFGDINHPAGSPLNDAPTSEPLGVNDEDYFVTFYINGAIPDGSLDMNIGGTGGFGDWNLDGVNTITLGSPGVSYDENSTTTICIYPNNTAVNSGTDWTLGEATITLDVTYELLVGTPVECTFIDGVLDIPYTCSKVCPTPAITDDAASICSGDLATEVSDWQATVAAANPASDADGTFTETLYTTTDLGATTTTAPDGVLPTGVHSALPSCNSEDQLLYAYIGCDEDCDGMTDSYIKAGTFTLTIFPPAQAPTEIVRDDAVCTYSITFACTGDAEGTTTVGGSTEAPGYGGATVDIEVVTAGGCTATFQLEKPPCPECGSVAADASGTQIFCDDNIAPDLSDAATGFSGAIGDLPTSLIWYLDQTTDMSSTAPATPYTGMADLNMPPDNCTPATTTLYAYFVCDQNADQTTFIYQEAGSISIEIYPTPPPLVESSDPNCSLSVNDICAGALTIEYSDNGGLSWTVGTSVPGTLATGDQADFRAYWPNGPVDSNGDPLCVSEISATAENCIAACPTTAVVTDDSGVVCNGGGTDDLSTWMAAVAAANPAGLFYSSVMPVAGTTAPDGLMPTGVHSNPTSCNPEDQIVMAYVYCDVDGSFTDNAGDTYTLVSTYALTVHPPAQAPTLTQTEACEDGTDGSCTYALTFACAGDSETTTVDGSTQTAPYLGGNVTVDVVTANGCTGSFDLNADACICAPNPGFICPTPPIVPKCGGVVSLGPETPNGVWSGSGAVYINANNEFDPTNAPVNTTLTLIYTVFDALGNPVSSATCTFEVTTDCEANGGRF